MVTCSVSCLSTLPSFRSWVCTVQQCPLTLWFLNLWIVCENHLNCCSPSDKSKRRTKTVKKSLEPKWNQTFMYSPVHRREFRERMLEITLWDQARVREEESEFLGEVGKSKICTVYIHMCWNTVTVFVILTMIRDCVRPLNLPYFLIVHLAKLFCSQLFSSSAFVTNTGAWPMVG